MHGRMIGAMVALLATAVVASACSSSSGKNDSSNASTTLRASFGPVPAGIDPAIVANLDHFVYQPMLGVLVTYPKGNSAGQFPPINQVKPDLAASWKKAKNGSYTFTLRSMRSSAGNPLTSSDVKWSFQRMLALNPISKLVLNVVGGDTTNPITVIDKRHFRLNAKSDNPNLLGALAQFEFGIVDSTATKAHATATDPWAKSWSATHMVSYGPYEVSSYTPSVEIDYRANPNYWDAKDVYYKKIVDRGVSDQSTTVTLLKSGQLDFAADVPFGSLKSLQQAGLTVNTEPTPVSETLELDDRKAPFNNVKVRQAISLGIDRAAINQDAFSGYGSPSKSLISTAVANAPTTTGTYFRHDTGKAKQLLAAAGYGSGLSFPLYYSAAGGTATQDAAAATLVKQQLAAIGVTVKLNPVASAAQFSAGTQSHSYQATLAAIGPLIPDISYYVGLEWATNQSLIAPGYTNSRLISLNTRANSTSGPHRSALLTQIMNIIDNDLPSITLVDIPNQWALQKGITGAYSNGTQGLYPWLLKAS